MDCPVCHETEPSVFFDAGELPVFVNVLHTTREDARAAPRGRIRLAGCDVCGMVHNVDFDADLVAYAPGYENSLHGSPTFQAWAGELAAGLVARHDLRDARAVEVGGGRGEFMHMLVDAGLGEGLVVDPSAPDDALASDAGGRVALERRLFRTEDVRREDGGRTGLVLTRHVLEHVEAREDFVETLVRAARDAGAGLYVEVPNGLWTLRDHGVWDVIYEHASYFVPSSLAHLLSRAGAASEPWEAFGSQFLSAEVDGAALRRGDAAPRRLDPERAREARALRDEFGSVHAALVERWRGQVGDARSRGRRLVIWGAGSKGATFLNTVDPEGVIVGAVDVNERKVGRFVAGSGHEVLAPASLAALRPDGILVMNPLYADEIDAMARSAGVQAEVMVVHP